MINKGLIKKVSKWYQIVSNWYPKVSEWYQEEEQEKYQNDTWTAQNDTKKVSNWATYIKTTITDNKENILKEKKPVKKKYLDFVLLTEEEYNKLIERYWKWTITRKIEDLNNYIGSKWKKYKSHYFTILEWLRKENIKPIEKKPEPTTQQNNLHVDTRPKWLKEALPLNK